MKTLFAFFVLVVALVAQAPKPGLIVGGSGSGGGGGTITGCGAGQTLNGTVCDNNPAVMTFLTNLQSGVPLYCEGSASNTATCSMNPALTAYTNGQLVMYKAGATNTTTHTINIDGLGAKSILTSAAGALSAGDVTSGRYYLLTYDGTQFRLPAAGSTAVTPSTRGAYASLPTCNSAIAGQVYYLTDRGVDGKTAQCNGTSWQWYMAGKPITEPPAVASWTAVNTPNCADSAGIVVCTPAPTGAGTFKSILRTIPTAPYDIEVDFSSYSDGNVAGCGIALTNGTTTSSGIKRMILNGGLSGTQNVIDIQYFSNYATFSNQLYSGTNGSAGPNGTVKMRITDNNTNRIWRVQTGGGVWLTLATESRTADITPTHYGIACQLAAGGLYQFSLVNLEVY